MDSSYNRLGWPPERQAGGELGAEETLYCRSGTDNAAIPLGTVVMLTGACSLCIRHGTQNKLNAGGFLMEAIETVSKWFAGIVLSHAEVG